jgi:TolB-like protein/tetratricopeptide (TPR) repeat protein
MIAPGVRLDDRYEIIAALGAGGMGEVYRARDLRLQRDVAVKVLPQRLARDASALARFEREALSLAALSNPHIVALHDFGEHEGMTYAVMELLEGETLRQRLQRSPLSWSEAVGLGVQIAEGLAAAHSKGVVHRDLKPENVIVAKSGALKILDFGLARTDAALPPDQAATTGPTEPGMVLGTLSYMPPEQVRGQAVDARSDIFALGCVLYEMVAGRPPFARATTADTVAALLGPAEPELPVGESSMPPALEQAVLRSLERDPDSRFQSAQDLAFALRMISGVSRALPPPPAMPSRRPAARLRWLAAAGLAAALAAAGWLAWTRRVRPPEVRSLAVLPFVNEGADPELDYLGDGIADTLIHDLSQLRDVRVMARSTVFRYRGPTVEPRAVGRDLKVDAVLTGRVVPRGDLLTVEVELVDVASGTRLWGERYQGPFARVMRVPEEVAREISSTLQLRLTHEQEARLARRETEDPEAYRLYLKGRFHWNKRTGDGFRRAVEFFEQASLRDPAYALPHVGLADAFALMAAYSVSPPGQSMPRARAAAERALALDDQLAEAHATLGLVKLLYDWDQAESERRFRRATSLKPGLASGHHWFAELLMASGRTDEALAELGRAEELDPLSLIVPTDRGRALFFARRYDRALAECQRSLDADRGYAPALITRGMVLEELGRYEEALVGYRQVASLTGDPQHGTMIARALALSGDRPGALRLLADIEHQARDRYVSPYSLALVHASLGHADEAFRQLDRAVEERSSWMAFAAVNPRLDSLRADPRFAEVRRRVGLSPP